MRLVASDMDGTVVGHDGRMSERTIRAFRACTKAGVDVVFVTGRPPRWLQPLREQLGHTGIVICSNGALTYDLEGERVLDAKLLGAEDVYAARDIIRGLFPAATFAAETVSGFKVESGFADPATSELLGGITAQPFEHSLPGEQVVKFLAREKNISPDEFLAAVRPAVGHLVSTTHSAPTMALLEMAVPDINKSVTLARYAAERGIDAADVVAFGDMPNDVQMLDWAGFGYAMASGHADALAAANLVAPPFDEDGVAQVLEERLARLRTI
ncbi:MAG: Haloacid dehalogenase [Micrococcaceae bacterium]|uniref:HAD family hydrolase n=1 Tax=Arthrobacter cheniae TaxID=1258888 RepID=A0A3A5MC34_9MICC|nr:MULTISPECIES: HAD family hydrolase [Arthrobacter]MCU1633344.1 Haloacid dehalogenase [Micrococcaceae bacterium]MEC5199426.1 Cof subfamily protein (haloacid dehalogenase superfamily) [Arthrobacter sp. PL16]RJT80137.1 HAD family hydrolase [Arthrobacter cheniae]